MPFGWIRRLRFKQIQPSFPNSFIFADIHAFKFQALFMGLFLYSIELLFELLILEILLLFQLLQISL